MDGKSLEPLIGELDLEPTTLANTCYSYVSADEAISVAGVYSSAKGAFSSVPDAGGISPLQDNDGLRKREAMQAGDWFSAITTETFL